MFIKKILTSNQIYERMYDVLDEDKSGFISFKEFMNYVLIL